MSQRVVNLRSTGPEPPSHLDTIERSMWASITKEYRFTGAAELDVLTSTLEAHMRARRCRETIDAQGELTPNRFGHLDAHPLLRHEQVARASYLSGMRLLRLDIGNVRR
jgi:hypothetical protein